MYNHKKVVFSCTRQGPQTSLSHKISAQDYENFLDVYNQPTSSKYNYNIDIINLNKYNKKTLFQSLSTPSNLRTQTCSQLFNCNSMIKNIFINLNLAFIKDNFTKSIKRCKLKTRQKNQQSVHVLSEKRASYRRRGLLTSAGLFYLLLNFIILSFCSAQNVLNSLNVKTPIFKNLLEMNSILNKSKENRISRREYNENCSDSRYKVILYSILKFF